MRNHQSFHENMSERDGVKLGSERSFGIVFATVFAIIAVLPIFTFDNNEVTVRVWALMVAVLLAIITFVRPQLLSPFNKIWFRFGLLLHKIINPLVMGLMFFVVISPIGMLMRALGKTPIKKRFDQNIDSYWITREPPGPEPETMKRQF